MTNCLNCGKVSPPSKGSRKRKYCSKSCAQKYYSKEQRYYKYKKKNPDWGSGGKKAAKTKKNKEEFEYAQKHYLSKEDVAELLDTKTTNLWSRAKKNNIKKIIAYEDGRQRTFYRPEDVEKMRITEAIIPKGYVTAEGAAEYLGLKLQSFWTMGSPRGRKRPEATMVQWGVGSNNTRRNLYSYKDLDKWIAEGEAVGRERQLLFQQKRQERAIAEEERLADIKRRTVDAGLVNVETAAQLLGFKGKHFTSSVPFTKINGRLWFKPEDLETYKVRRKVWREAERLERLKNKVPGNRKRYPLRKDDWTSDEAYEKRRKQLARCKPAKYIANDPNAMKIWNIHTEPWKLEVKEGEITQLPCNTCKETLEYSRFRIDIKCSSLKRFGRQRICKACEKIKWPRGAGGNPKTRGKLATQFANSIIRSLTKRNQRHVAIPQRMVWKQIKDHLGYTKEDFLNHVESQFKAWMTWENNGRPKDVDTPAWQLDHIKPKSSFDYTSISDEEFKECWALGNLRPIEARINIVKSSKDLRSYFNSSYSSGLKSKKICSSGIWHYLPYTNFEAKIFFESLFSGEMSWENHGTVWQLDHLVPQAYLSYVEPSSDNFQKCWELSNLEPTLIKENISKGSRYKNKLWHYNNI